MAEIIQRQEPEAFPPNTGNGSQSRQPKQRSVAEPIKDKPTGLASVRKGTGPRTTQGKERSKLNALKSGLFSKAVLLKGESRAEYLSLLNGLRDDLRPEGTFEAVLVENLAALLWRKRRLFQAENAEISEKIEFTESDSIGKRYVEAWDQSRAAIESGGLLKFINNPFVVREAKEVLASFRQVLTTYGFREDSRLLAKLYGRDQDGGTPHGLRLHYELYAALARLAQKRGDDKSEETELKKIMVAFMDREIERLTEIEKLVETADTQRLEYKSSAAIIPGQEASERLLRYETHFSREIDRILNQLERLQRIRNGQPVPPTLNVNLAT